MAKDTTGNIVEQLNYTPKEYIPPPTVEQLNKYPGFQPKPFRINNIGHMDKHLGATEDC